MRERFMVVWSEVRTDAALECTARFSAFGLASGSRSAVALLLLLELRATAFPLQNPPLT